VSIQLVAANSNRTIVVVFRVGVGTMIETSIYVVLVLAGDAVLAVALTGAAPHEPYGVGNEFRWRAEDR